MPTTKVEGQELKKLVKLGKRKTLSFAFAPGDRDDHHFFLDKKIKPKPLGQALKKETAATKFSFGTCVLNGKDLELSCERVLPAMAKKLKKYLKKQKVPVNVVIMDENGNVVESDVEELPDDPEMDATDPDEGQDDGEAQAAASQAQAQAQEEQDDAAPQGPTPAELAARLKAVQPALAAAQGDAVAKLKKATAAAVAAIKGGDLTAAERTIALVENAAQKLSQRVSGETPPVADPKPAPAQDARAIAARATSVRDVITTLPEAATKKLTAALTTAIKLLKAGDLAVAAATLDKIEAAANKVLAATAPQQGEPGADQTAQSARDAEPASDDAQPDESQSDEARKWAAEEARLQPLVDKLMAEKRGDLDAINRAFNYAKSQAQAGEYASALKAAERTAQLIDAAEGMETTAAAAEAQDAVPDDVVPFVQSRLNWIETRRNLQSDFESLKAAIDAATRDIPGLEDVPSRSGDLFEHLAQLDTDLEDTLERLVETPDGDRREALKAEAVKIIAAYRNVLDSPFFQAVDDNGFANTNIRGAALNSLQQVSAVLAA